MILQLIKCFAFCNDIGGWDQHVLGVLEWPKVTPPHCLAKGQTFYGTFAIFVGGAGEFVIFIFGQIEAVAV